MTDEARGASLALYLTVLVGIAAAAMAGLALAADYGRTRAAGRAPGVPAPEPSAAPASVVLGGARVAVASARSYLAGGQRSRAVVALDGADRAVSVARRAVAGPGVAVDLATVAAALDDARQAFDVDDPSAARRALDDAVAAARAATARPGAHLGGPPDASQRAAYRGAVLINATGDRIGEVLGLEGEGGTATARVAVGGARDLLGIGLFDVGGTTVTVGAGTLAWGPAPALGPVMVTAPVMGDTLSQ